MKQPEKPKILMIAFEVIPSPTGASATVGDLLRGLTPVFDVDLLTVHAPGMPHVQKYYGARVFRVPVGKGTFLNRTEVFRRAVVRQLDSNDYELVHSFSLWGAHPVLEELGHHDYRTVFHVETLESLDLKYHYPELRHDRRLSRTLQARESMCLELSDRVVVPTEVGASYLGEREVEASRLAVLPPGVDVTLFHPRREPRGAGPPLLVYAGSLAPWQGLTTALYALAGLRRREVRLRIVAPTVRRWAEPLHELIDRESLQRQVEFIEPVPRERLPALLQEGHLAIAPLTRTDRNAQLGTSPTRLLEYLACGLPTLASRLPSIEEVVTDGSQGVLVQPGDPEALATRFGALLDDPDQRSALGAAGAQRARQAFGIGPFWRRWLELYATLLGIPVPRLALPEDELEVEALEDDVEEIDAGAILEEEAQPEAPKTGVLAPQVETGGGSGPSTMGDLDENVAGAEVFEDLWDDDDDDDGVADDDPDLGEAPATDRPTAEAREAATERTAEAAKRATRLRRRYYHQEGLLDSLLQDSNGDESADDDWEDPSPRKRKRR